MKPDRNRLDSIRNRLGGGSAGQARRRSRRDTEAQYQRVFLLSMISVAAVIALILGGGAIYEYMIKPNQVLAEVNGHEIKRQDYWRYQSVSLYNMARQYEAFAMQSQNNPQQQQQFLQFSASFDAQREDIWGSTDVSDATIQQMIDDRLYLDGAESLGVTVSDDQLQQFSLNQFSPANAPLITPEPSPTMIPERAQAATETAEAQATQQAIAMGTIVPTTVASPAADGTPGATPVVSGTPVVAGTPGATPVVAGTPGATPVTDGTSGATPVAGASPDATPNLEDARRGAEAEFEIFQDNVFEEAHLSEGQYLDLWVRPQYVRQLVDHRLTNEVPQVAEMVNANHIIVGTEELANQLYEQATGGASFEELARSNSTDTATAATGGKLGWFTRLEVDPALADAAFALEPGQISKPIQTAYGWQIVQVVEKEQGRPLSESQYQLATEDAVETWLEEQRANSDISTDHEPAETPTPEAFQPPPGAPTAVVPTPTPTPATPIIGPLPVTPGAGTPVTGTAVVTPAGTPAATPVASPVASPTVPATPAG